MLDVQQTFADGSRQQRGDATEADGGFIGRLRALVGLLGSASALARKAGISQSGLHRYLSGGEPTRKVLVALARAADVNLQWLMTGQGPMESSAGAPQREPIIGAETLTRVALYAPNGAGSGSATAQASPGILTGVAFCKSWLGRQGLDAQHLVAAVIRGNSMEPTIRNGDNVLIDLGMREVQDGDIYAFRDGDALMIKRLQRQLGGKLRMISDNAQYPVIELPVNAVDVIGRVVWRGSVL